jgi:DNA polymerase IV
MPKLARFRALPETPSERNPSTAPPGEAGDTPILHVDMDAFFVSVELLARPELRGKPVIVGGQRDQRGVVTSASYEARGYGVHSGMSLRAAGKLCPQAIFPDGHHELYGKWSDRVTAILGRYSPAVQMASVDEAYLDLSGTGRLHGPPLASAHALLREITEQTGLPCSGGLARTRLVAKVASDQAKPRGLLWVPAGAEVEFLAPLSVRRIPGIGQVTEAALNALGIETVAQLAQISREKLEENFGQWGLALYRKARGDDAWEFVVDGEAKSISHDHTFGVDTADRAGIEAMLSLLVQKAGKRLREAGLWTRTVQLRIRDARFHNITRQQTLPHPAQVDAPILDAVRELFSTAWPPGQKIRLVGVALSSFSSSGGEQLGLLDAEAREKQERLARAADLLRDRFGFLKIQLGGSLNPSKHLGDGSSDDSPDNSGNKKRVQ